MSAATPTALRQQADTLDALAATIAAQARSLRALADDQELGAPDDKRAPRHVTRVTLPEWCSERAFDRACASKQLRTFLVGRATAILRTDLQRWIESDGDRAGRVADSRRAHVHRNRRLLGDDNAKLDALAGRRTEAANDAAPRARRGAR